MSYFLNEKHDFSGYKIGAKLYVSDGRGHYRVVGIYPVTVVSRTKTRLTVQTKLGGKLTFTNEGRAYPHSYHYVLLPNTPENEERHIKEQAAIDAASAVSDLYEAGRSTAWARMLCVEKLNEIRICAARIAEIIEKGDDA